MVICIHARDHIMSHRVGISCVHALNKRAVVYCWMLIHTHMIKSPSSSSSSYDTWYYSTMNKTDKNDSFGGMTCLCLGFLLATWARRHDAISSHQDSQRARHDDASLEWQFHKIKEWNDVSSRNFIPMMSRLEKIHRVSMRIRTSTRRINIIFHHLYIYI
jgi:hypothetical protein